MITIIRKFIAWIQTKLEYKKIQEQKDSERILELQMMKLHPVPEVGPFIPHPGYADHLRKCIKNFAEYRKTWMRWDNDRTIGIGDSILAQARDRLHSINPLLNFALGGMWAHHMLLMLYDLTVIFMNYKFVPKIIVVGTPGGNNLLNRQTVASVIDYFETVLDHARFVYPNAKIIVYGLPMTINSYLIQAKPKIDAAMKWAVKGNNAVYLKLEKRFTSENHILPNKDESQDGVHLTPLGQVNLDLDIMKGKKAKPGSVIA